MDPCRRYPIHYSCKGKKVAVHQQRRGGRRTTTLCTLFPKVIVWEYFVPALPSIQLEGRNSIVKEVSILKEEMESDATLLVKPEPGGGGHTVQ